MYSVEVKLLTIIKKKLVYSGNVNKNKNIYLNDIGFE